MVVDDQRGGHSVIVAHTPSRFLLDFPDLRAISGKGPTTRRAPLRTVAVHMQSTKERIMFVGKSLFVLAVTGLGLAAPAATASTAASATKMHLVAHITQGGIVGGVSQQRLGAVQIGSGNLTDAAGRATGTFAFTCTSVRVNKGYVDEQCSSWGSFTGGQLILGGMSRSNTDRHTWAVTGGTGIYREARGEARLRDINDRTTMVDITLVSSGR
jgi:hypothetical protein